MGEPPPRIHQRAPSASGVGTVRKVIKHQSKYWRCLYPKEASSSKIQLPTGGANVDKSLDFDSIPYVERLHGQTLRYSSTIYSANIFYISDTIRNYQAKCLYEVHQMSPLWLFRERISKSYEGEVLAR